MAADPLWVMDTSAFTHIWRAGYGPTLKVLAPGGVVVVPDRVSFESDAGRERHQGIPPISDIEWVQLAVLRPDEEEVETEFKAEMGGPPKEHLGECAVVAVAERRGHVAIIDERVAKNGAEDRGLTVHDTLWIVMEAYLEVFGEDREQAVAMVDALLATGMKLPIRDGTSLFAWAYEEGYLPRD